MRKTMLFLLLLSCIYLFNCSSQKSETEEQPTSSKDTVIEQVTTYPDYSDDTVETIKAKTLAEFLNSFEDYKIKELNFENGKHLLDELNQISPFKHTDALQLIIKKTKLTKQTEWECFYVNEEPYHDFSILDFHNFTIFKNQEDKIIIPKTHYAQAIRRPNIELDRQYFSDFNKLYFTVTFETFFGARVNWLDIYEISNIPRYCLRIDLNKFNGIYCQMEHQIPEEICEKWTTDINIKNDSIFLKQNIVIGERKCTKYNTFSLLDSTIRRVMLNSNCLNSKISRNHLE